MNTCADTDHGTGSTLFFLIFLAGGENITISISPFGSQGFVAVVRFLGGILVYSQ